MAKVQLPTTDCIYKYTNPIKHTQEPFWKKGIEIAEPQLFLLNKFCAIDKVYTGTFGYRREGSYLHGIRGVRNPHLLIKKIKVMIDLSKDGFMSEEGMRAKAPSIFNTKPSDSVSKHYTHIPSTKVISDMKTLGWDVVDVTEVKARKESTIGVQKHLIVFRNPDVVINGEDGDTVYPQILLTNSHDGKNAFKFQAGLFRLICANGLVIATESFQDVKMRHMGYTFEELQIKIREMVERLPLTVDSMNKMKEVEMSQEMAVEFAKRALGTRFTEKEINNVKINFEELLNPVRTEDSGNDVWSVFNVVQEKIISGDFHYTNGIKVRKARKVKNFSQDQKINKELFQLALEYAN